MGLVTLAFRAPWCQDVFFPDHKHYMGHSPGWLPLSRIITCPFKVHLIIKKKVPIFLLKSPKWLHTGKMFFLIIFSQYYICIYAAAVAKSLQSCPTLCDPRDGSPPGSPVPGIFQARTLEWVAISFSNAWKWKVKVKVKSCPTLSDPMDCSLPGSSIHGIFQARVLEWGAICM